MNSILLIFIVGEECADLFSNAKTWPFGCGDPAPIVCLCVNVLEALIDW